MRRPSRYWLRLKRAIESLGASPGGSRFFVTVGRRLDPWLLRLSGGRISSAATQPVLLLTTVGAKSGLQRTTPVIYLEDGGRYVVVASNGGLGRLPAWYHNLRARPEASIEIHGRTVPVRARIAAGEERRELWEHAVRRYRGYRTYQERAGEQPIPVVVLEPR